MEVRDPVDAHGRFGGLTHREQQRDLIRIHAAGDEGQDVDRLPIEPLRVVDDAQQRTFARRVAEQRQRRQPDEKDVATPVAAQPERRFQGLSLRFGQPVTRRQEREKEAVQRGEPHSHLRLDADDSEHGEIAGVRDGIVEQRRLPDARFAAQHEGTGAAGSGGVDDAIDRRPLRAATEKHDATVPSPAPSPARRQVPPVDAERLHVLGDSSRGSRPSCSWSNPTDDEARQHGHSSLHQSPSTTPIPCPSPSATSSPRSEVGS